MNGSAESAVSLSKAVGEGVDKALLSQIDVAVCPRSELATALLRGGVSARADAPRPYILLI